MNLFSIDPSVTVLPCDGTVNYHGPILTPEAASGHQAALLQNVSWQNDEVILFGKRIITTRKVAWYGDANFSYAYSGTSKNAQPWTGHLRILKEMVERQTGATFNSCLLNLYHDGHEGMGWHSDDEKSLERHASIASLSFGAERKFCFKHKRKPLSTAIILEHGSLLVMKDETQSNWLHSLPKMRRVHSPRINLTFRTFME